MTVPYGIEVPDRIPSERYYDPGFADARGRAALVPHVADGVSARGDPRPPRLRGVPDPRPVGDRGAPGRRLGRRVPELLSAPGRAAGRGARPLRQVVHLPVPRMVLRHRRQERRGHPEAFVRRAQRRSRRARPRAGALRHVRRLCVRQLRSRGTAAARQPRADGERTRRVEDRLVARRSGGTRRACR